MMKGQAGLTAVELRMIKEFILLPLLMTAFERDLKRISAAVKTPGPYAELLQRVLDRITVDLAQIRRQFRIRGIKVYDPERTAAGIRAEFKCRGYLSEYGILNNVLKAEAEIYMKNYLHGESGSNSGLAENEDPSEDGDGNTDSLVSALSAAFVQAEAISSTASRTAGSGEPRC